VGLPEFLPFLGKDFPNVRRSRFAAKMSGRLTDRLLFSLRYIV
jgi:hypothetical protein